MNKKADIMYKINLANTKNGIITISHINEPYGDRSTPVVSIGISLSGNTQEPDWKAHIPYENLDEVIKALQSIKKDFI